MDDEADDLPDFSDNSKDESDNGEPQWEPKADPPPLHKTKSAHHHGYGGEVRVSLTSNGRTIEPYDKDSGSHNRHSHKLGDRRGGGQRVAQRNEARAQHQEQRNMHYKRADRRMDNNEEHIDSNRPTKSSQSDSNSNHENNSNYDLQNPKSPSSSLSPNKRVSLTSNLFQKALGAANHGRTASSASAQSAAGGDRRNKGGDERRDDGGRSSRRQGAANANDIDGPSHPRNRGVRDSRKTKRFPFDNRDFDDQRSQRSRRSSDSRGSPGPIDDYPRNEDSRNGELSPTY